MPTEEEVRLIIELYDNGNGLSHGQIAKKLNYNQSTITRAINNFLKKNQDAPGNAHESSHQCKTKNAIEAKHNYDLARRLALNNKFFKRLDEFVDNPITARDFKELMVAYGILEDKRQLLEPILPEPTKTKLDALIEMMEKDDPVPVPEAEGSIS